MSVQNPLVANFRVDMLDVPVGFTAHSLNDEALFRCATEIRTIIYTGTYIYSQSPASDHWRINHNMNKYPSVTIVDTANTVVVGDVVYIDANTVECLFTSPFSGTAYLN